MMTKWTISTSLTANGQNLSALRRFSLEEGLAMDSSSLLNLVIASRAVNLVFMS